MTEQEKIIHDLRNEVQVQNILLKKADDLLIEARRAHRLGAQTGSHWIQLGAAILNYSDMRQRAK